MTMNRADLAAYLGITEDELTRLYAVEDQGRQLASELASMALIDLESRNAETLMRNGDHGEQAMALWDASSAEVQKAAITFLTFLVAQSKHTGQAVR